MTAKAITSVKGGMVWGFSNPEAKKLDNTCPTNKNRPAFPQ
jgi:hypothetical protein